MVVKRNRNSEYCFAFAEMKGHDVAADCIKKYFPIHPGSIKQISTENKSKFSSKMTPNVEKTQSNSKIMQFGLLQLRQKRSLCPRMQSSSHWYFLNKIDDRGYGRRDRSRSRSRSDSYRRSHKHKKRYRSYSRDSDRSYERDRKEKSKYCLS